MRHSFLLLLLPSSLLAKTITSTTNNHHQDLHPECPQWAAEGSCRTDPTFMLQECAESCSKEPEFRKVEVQHVKEGVDASFFELGAVDYRGNVVEFERLEGYITIVLNIPKVCGKAKEVYSTLEQLHSVWPWTLAILIFPYPPSSSTTNCNDEYKKAAMQHSKNLLTFQDITLNGGPKEHAVYSYFKNIFKIQEFEEENGCTFLVNPDGDIVEYHHRQHIPGLKEYIAGHLQADL